MLRWAVRVKVRGAAGLLPVKVSLEVSGQVWDGGVGVVAGYNRSHWFSSVATLTTPLPLTPPPLPPPDPSTAVHNRRVRGPSSRGELTRGWGSLMHPLITHFGHYHLPSCSHHSPSTPPPSLAVGAHPNGSIRT